MGVTDFEDFPTTLRGWMERDGIPSARALSHALKHFGFPITQVALSRYLAGTRTPRMTYAIILHRFFNTPREHRERMNKLTAHP